MKSWKDLLEIGTPNTEGLDKYFLRYQKPFNMSYLIQKVHLFSWDGLKGHNN